MQFLVLGFDGKDKAAPKRREAARGKHITLGNDLVASGNMWYGAALLDNEGGMEGSMLLMDFPSENELQEWLGKEPYVIEKVWKKLEIRKCKTRDPWQFNRPKEFFENRS